MATFQYIAKDASGAERRGTVEAGDRSAAIAAVRAQGLLPTALGEVKGAAAAPAAKKAAAPKAEGEKKPATKKAAAPKAEGEKKPAAKKTAAKKTEEKGEV